MRLIEALWAKFFKLQRICGEVEVWGEDRSWDMGIICNGNVPFTVHIRRGHPPSSYYALPFTVCAFILWRISATNAVLNYGKVFLLPSSQDELFIHLTNQTTCI